MLRRVRSRLRPPPRSRVRTGVSLSLTNSPNFAGLFAAQLTGVPVHILAAVAEHERHMIADRTKAALQAAKARGIRLGQNGTDRLAPAHRAAAMERARQLAPVLAELKSTGLSARQMAAQLTARGISTPNGAKWHAQTVIRVMNRAEPRHPSP